MRRQRHVQLIGVYTGIRLQALVQVRTLRGRLYSSTFVAANCVHGPLGKPEGAAWMDAEPIALVDLVCERVDDALKQAGERERVRICRELIRAKPRDVLQHAAALRRLTAMLKKNAVPDLLPALGHEDEILYREAVELGSRLSGVDWNAQLKKATSDRQASGIRTIMEAGGATPSSPGT